MRNYVRRPNVTQRTRFHSLVRTRSGHMSVPVITLCLVRIRMRTSRRPGQHTADSGATSVPSPRRAGCRAHAAPRACRVSPAMSARVVTMPNAAPAAPHRGSCNQPPTRSRGVAADTQLYLQNPPFPHKNSYRPRPPSRLDSSHSPSSFSTARYLRDCGCSAPILASIRTTTARSCATAATSPCANCSRAAYVHARTRDGAWRVANGRCDAAGWPRGAGSNAEGGSDAFRAPWPRAVACPSVRAPIRRAPPATPEERHADADAATAALAATDAVAAAATDAITAWT